MVWRRGVTGGAFWEDCFWDRNDSGMGRGIVVCYRMLSELKLLFIDGHWFGLYAIIDYNPRSHYNPK